MNEITLGLREERKMKEKIINAKLIRVNKTDRSGKIRGDENIEGYYKNDPVVGRAFSFFAESFSGYGSFRLIETSYVEALTNDGFITESGSEYKIEKIGK